MTSRVVYSEIEPFAREWLKNLVAKDLITPGAVVGDIRDFDDDLRGVEQLHAFAGIGVWSHALRLAGWPDDVPVWTGSCPCQPFSQAGRRKGFDDARHLWPEWFRLIRASRPPVILGEQVASPDGLAWFDAVSSDLEGEGYTSEAVDLCAAGVGAPHLRQRLFFVAFADVQRCQGLGVQLRERRSRAPVPEARGSGAAHVVADTRSEGRIEVSPNVRGGREGSGAQGLEQRSLHGGDGELGDASGARSGRHPRGLPRPKEGGDRRWLEAGSVADVPELAGATRGFWSGSDFVLCQDAKLRPIEPGTFPLAHGASARVGRLRAYGNAIVAPLATVFVEAVIDYLIALAETP